MNFIALILPYLVMVKEQNYHFWLISAAR